MSMSAVVPCWPRHRQGPFDLYFLGPYLRVDNEQSGPARVLYKGFSR